MKKNIKQDPFTNLILDEEEKSIEATLEREEYESDLDFEDSKKMLEEAANRHLELHKTKPITIRVNQLDLIKVKAKAKNHNIPYQTLLSTLINQYARGKMRLSL